jgi:hypothetical protein
MKLLKRLQATLARKASQPESSRVAFPGSAGKPFPALAVIAAAYQRAAMAPPVVVFGDSVMERVSRDDTDQRPLGEMIAAALPRRALILSQSAFNPSVYRALAAVLVRAAARPEQVVVPINLRSFSPQWDLHPAWQFGQELAAVENFLRDSRRIPAIADVLEGPDFFRDYDAVPIKCTFSDCSTVGDFRRLVDSSPHTEEGRNARARQIFAFHYAYELTRDHRKLADLVRCIQLLTRAHIRTLVYLTPVNVEAGSRLAGAPWRSALRSNANVVLSAVGAAGSLGLSVLNWSEALPASHFFHDDLSTEHLNEHGRTKLASLVVAELERAAGA